MYNTPFSIIATLQNHFTYFVLLLGLILKHKKKRGPRKNQLPVTKISITRGPKSNAYYETTDSGLIQTSPTSMAEDVSTSPSQDIDTRLKTLQIQSRPRRNQDHTEPRELRRTSRNSGRYIEGQYMESDSE